MRHVASHWFLKSVAHSLGSNTSLLRQCSPSAAGTVLLTFTQSMACCLTHALDEGFDSTHSPKKPPTGTNWTNKDESGNPCLGCLLCTQLQANDNHPFIPKTQVAHKQGFPSFGDPYRGIHNILTFQKAFKKASHSDSVSSACSCNQ